MCSVCRRRPFLRISKQREADDDDERPLFASLFANTKCAMLFLDEIPWGMCCVCACLSFPACGPVALGVSVTYRRFPVKLRVGRWMLGRRGVGGMKIQVVILFLPEPVDKDKIFTFRPFPSLFLKAPTLIPRILFFSAVHRKRRDNNKSKTQ